MTRVTLDSNIYLSALVFGGKPMRLLEVAVEGEIAVAISDAIIQEVRRNLQQKFGWSDARTAEAIDAIAAFTNHVTPVEDIDAVPSAPHDNRVLECALAADSDVIVSGDSDLLALGSFRGINVVRAAEFLAQFSARRP